MNTKERDNQKNASAFLQNANVSPKLVKTDILAFYLSSQLIEPN